MDGMKDTPLSYTCERRSEYIVDGAPCIEAFLHCCKEIERQRAERKHDSLIPDCSKKLGQEVEGSLGWLLPMVVIILEIQNNH